MFFGICPLDTKTPGGESAMIKGSLFVGKVSSLHYALAVGARGAKRLRSHLLSSDVGSTISYLVRYTLPLEVEKSHLHFVFVCVLLCFILPCILIALPLLVLKTLC